MTFPDLFAFAVGGTFWRWLGIFLLVVSPLGALGSALGQWRRK